MRRSIMFILWIFAVSLFAFSASHAYMGPDGSNFTISDSVGSDTLPDVAFDSVDDQYLVVWQSEAGADSDIVVARLDASGAVLDSFALVDEDTNSETPEVTWLASNNLWVVAWADDRNGDWDIYTITITGGTSSMGVGQRITTATEDDVNPDVGSESYDDTFLVVWQRDYASDTSDVMARFLDSDGLPGAAAFNVDGLSLHDCANPAVSQDDFAGWLVAWEYGSGGLYVRGVESDGDVPFAAIGIGTEDDDIVPSVARRPYPALERVVAWSTYLDEFTWNVVSQEATFSSEGSVGLNVANSLFYEEIDPYVVTNQIGAKEYYFVWTEDPFTDNDIAARVYTSQNLSVDQVVTVCGEAGEQSGPRMALQSIDNERTKALVVWQDDRSDDLEIYGQFLDYCTRLTYADFSADVTSVCESGDVSFTDETSSTDTILSWTWDFGDEQGSSQQHPTHTYSGTGLYTVSLEVVGECSRDQEVKEEYIEVKDTPTADFSGEPTLVCLGRSVEFEQECAGGAVDFSWDFGDGGTSSDPSPVHDYVQTGTFDVELTCSNACGSDAILKTDYITVDPEVIADFTADATLICSGDTVGFTDQSSGEINAYLWDFGDGQTSTDPNPTHAYELSGMDYLNFTVSLDVTADCGDDSEEKTNYIEVHAPLQADFTADRTEINMGEQVQFTNQTTGDVISYSWDFGDGEGSVESDPAHVYNQAGEFDVSLTVNGVCDPDTESKVDYIVVLDPGDDDDDTADDDDDTADDDDDTADDDDDTADDDDDTADDDDDTTDDDDDTTDDDDSSDDDDVADDDSGDDDDSADDDVPRENRSPEDDYEFCG